MVLEQDRSGWMIFDVMVERVTFSTVVTMAWVYTTVAIARMFLSAAAMVIHRNNIVFSYQLIKLKR